MNICRNALVDGFIKERARASGVADENLKSGESS